MLGSPFTSAGAPAATVPMGQAPEIVPSAPHPHQLCQQQQAGAVQVPPMWPCPDFYPAPLPSESLVSHGCLPTCNLLRWATGGSISWLAGRCLGEAVQCKAKCSLACSLVRQTARSMAPLSPALPSTAKGGEIGC